MFRSVLIANRGEIACRIARTAKRMGMRTIAVYSAADADALHRRVCDEAIFIGPPPPRESYLSIARVVGAARAAKAECVHPGYGFLSENADFATACAEAGLRFVGPSPAAIRDMGLKDRAKALMEKAGVPIVPGYHGERQDAAFLEEKAYEIGYPVLIKLAAGGGGRGLRRVDRHADFEAALESAIREGQGAFGNSRVILEKYVASARHIEIQVFGDSHGNVIHLGERDCSLQRRHQKVVEEAPAPGMRAELRARMGEAAVTAARAVHYEGAGTVEFVADGTRGLRTDAFWFIEMNTRLQVEHPVTEAVTGLDLVEWQFRVAAGERLPLGQSQVKIDGHAVEARIYAEDPANDFLPSTGRIVAMDLPRDVRVDTGYEAGGEVTPFYDPMLAKVIAHAPTRAAALERLAAAIGQTLIAGPRTNVAFLAALCRAPEFRDGRIDTGYLDSNLAMLGGARGGRDAGAAALGVARLLAEDDTDSAQPLAEGEAVLSPWAARDGFQLGAPRVLAVPIVVDGNDALATLTYDAQNVGVTVDGSAPRNDARAFVRRGEAFVVHDGRQTRVSIADFARTPEAAASSDGLVKAPMHGRVLQLLVDNGAAVSAGQQLAVIEAMKMEHTLHAPFAGVVARIAVAAGAQVVEGGEIMLIEPAATR